MDDGCKQNWLNKTQTMKQGVQMGRGNEERMIIGERSTSGG